jgi:MFS family permease
MMHAVLTYYSYFYYGTSIFRSVGISNSFVTSMILGGVNFGMTFPGLYIVEKFGRRPALIAGALWMFMCFLVFASLGHFALDDGNGNSNQGVGYAMITFACLFIAGYAMTWGPIAWAGKFWLYEVHVRHILTSYPYLCSGRRNLPFAISCKGNGSSNRQ